MNFFPRSFLRCSSRDLSFSHIKIKQIIRYHNSEQAFRTGHPFPQPISRRESNEIKSITELYYFKVFFFLQKVMLLIHLDVESRKRGFHLETDGTAQQD